MTAQCNLIGQGVLGIPQLRESGIPAKIISTLLRYHSECHSADFLVLKDSLCKRIEDLKGKTIAVVSGKSQNMVSVRWAVAERHKMTATPLDGLFVGKCVYCGTRYFPRLCLMARAYCCRRGAARRRCVQSTIKYPCGERAWLRFDHLHREQPD